MIASRISPRLLNGWWKILESRDGGGETGKNPTDRSKSGRKQKRLALLFIIGAAIAIGLATENLLVGWGVCTGLLVLLGIIRIPDLE